MGKAIAGCLGVLASIAGILGLFIALNIIHPFPIQSTPTPTALSALIVSPSSIKAESNCNAGNPRFELVGHITYTCNVALSASGQGSLNWAASGGLSGTQFNPQRGTLEPGQSVTVTVSLGVTNGLLGTSQTCPTTVNLIFTNETNPANTAIVSWSC